MTSKSNENDKTTKSNDECKDKKLNCWEFFNCRSNPSSQITDPTTICEALLHIQSDTINGGIAGGRHCWEIPETLCEGNPENTDSEGGKNCNECSFRKLVMKEEGKNFQE